MAAAVISGGSVNRVQGKVVKNPGRYVWSEAITRLPARVSGFFDPRANLEEAAANQKGA
jgi:hypothetical protein